MTGPGRRRAGRSGVLALALVTAVLAGCGRAETPAGSTETSDTGPSTSTGRVVAAKGTVSTDDIAMPDPGRLTRPTVSADLLIYSRRTLDQSTVAKVRRLRYVTDVEPISMATFFVEAKPVTFAAVDPDSFRRFTLSGTAQTTAVWRRVAGGEIAIRPGLARRLQDRQGYVRIGNEKKAPEVHVGAYAELLSPTVSRPIDAVLNRKWAKPLGLQKNNALLVSTGARNPQRLMKSLRRFAAANGTPAQVSILGPNLDPNAPQTALVAGGSVARAIGSFTYRANSDGSVVPDPRWVAANIRTEPMPIIGPVTGHRVMLPQLRGALTEVVRQGLADKIYSFAGCYVPRYIAGTTTLSFHTFGTAVDFNVADNARGTVGKMDRTVVEIFKSWGFAWGGDWSYTDPMHFELARAPRGA